MTCLSWDPILARAVEIVEAHNTPMSLRQVFYRLASEGALGAERETL